MFVPMVLLASLAVALLRGGHLHNLLLVKPRLVWLFFVPLIMQLIAFSSAGGTIVFGFPLARILYFLSMGIAVLALWLNRHLPGVLWIAAGLSLNFLVITLNGGFMPVSDAAREFAGLPPVTERSMNVIPADHAVVLPWLTDVLPLPGFLPFANVFSVGDVLVAIGGVIFIQETVTMKSLGLGLTSLRIKLK